MAAEIDPVVADGVKLLKIDRGKLWANRDLNGDRRLLAAIKNTRLKDIVEKRGQTGIAFFNTWRRGARKLGDLTRLELEALRMHLDPIKLEKIRIAISINPGLPEPDFNETYLCAKLHKPLIKLTSKEIRTSRGSKPAVSTLKIGTILTENECLNWGLKLSKLTSSRHKNTILKISHGDVYTREKLLRFGMTDSDTCPRCDRVETLRHKIIECHYSNRIWQAIKPLINKLQDEPDPNPDPINFSIAATPKSNVASMTLTAEILQTILSLKPDQTFLMHPRYLAKRAVKNLAIKEGNSKIKGQFIRLLNEELN